jgi:steroid 5-alpha reductase family enzyme
LFDVERHPGFDDDVLWWLSVYNLRANQKQKRQDTCVFVVSVEKFWQVDMHLGHHLALIEKALYSEYSCRSRTLAYKLLVFREVSRRQYLMSPRGGTGDG